MKRFYISILAILLLFSPVVFGQFEEEIGTTTSPATLLETRSDEKIFLLFSGTELILQPSTKDNFFNPPSPTTNYGDYEYIRVMLSGVNKTRGILSFDASEIPAGATINNATLMLYYWETNNGDPVGEIVWAYKITRDNWEEMTSSWNNYKTASAWTTGGGDYTTSNPLGGSVVFPASYGWVSWEIVDIVQDAINNVLGQVNILLRFDNEDLNAKDILFYSKETTGDSALKPKLIIDYSITPPAPEETPVILDDTFFVVDYIFGDLPLIYFSFLILIGLIFSLLYQMTKR